MHGHVTAATMPANDVRAITTSQASKLQGFGFRRTNNVFVQADEQVLLVIVFKRRQQSRKVL
jgi:hypothetical protein